MLIHLPSSELLLGPSVISREDGSWCNKKKPNNLNIIGTKWERDIVFTTSPSELQDPKMTCTPSHFQTSQLLEEEIM